MGTNRRVRATALGLLVAGAVFAPALPASASVFEALSATGPASAAGSPPAAVPAATQPASYATVTSPSMPLNVRSGPGTGYARVSTLANRSRVSPTCQASGQRIAGPVRTTNLWDRLPSGAYVSDAYLSWSPSRPNLPTCTTAPAAAKPTAAPPVVPSPVAPMTHNQFIAAVAGPAQAGARMYRVPASVTLAQAILESGWGGSGLSARDRNYFGIKCSNGVYGPLAIGCHTYATSECSKGSCWPTTASFRVYASLSASIADHGRFLVVNSRYGPAFAYRNNPNQFAVRLQLAGYATSPTYAQTLQSLMRQYNLYRYDIRIP